MLENTERRECWEWDPGAGQGMHDLNSRVSLQRCKIFLEKMELMLLTDEKTINLYWV
jgi:hypothetical protein